MLKFLTTLILALILFIPACLFVSNFFRLSEQAEQNFGEFVSTLRGLQDPNVPVGTHKTIFLIVDIAMAIVYFEPNSKEVLVEVDAVVPYTDYTIHIKRPSCPLEKKCVCLIRKPEFEVSEDVLDISSNAILVMDKTAICEELNYDLKVTHCGWGTAHYVNAYTCKNGFMIERHLADESSWIVSAYYETSRRAAVQLIKEGNSIIIEEIK